MNTADIFYLLAEKIVYKNFYNYCIGVNMQKLNRLIRKIEYLFTTCYYLSLFVIIFRILLIFQNRKEPNFRNCSEVWQLLDNSAGLH